MIRLYPRRRSKARQHHLADGAAGFEEGDSPRQTDTPLRMKGETSAAFRLMSAMLPAAGRAVIRKACEAASQTVAKVVPVIFGCRIDDPQKFVFECDGEHDDGAGHEGAPGRVDAEEDDAAADHRAPN
jgi:hypothetical protein